MPTIGVYRIISPTFKYYFGKSINVERRLKAYSKAQCKTQPKLYRSIIKHGWESHRVDIVECGEEHLDMLEKYYIEFFKTRGKQGLNCMAGGNGCRRPTEEQRKRMSESKKGLLAGEKNPMWGKKWPKERKDSRAKWLKDNVEQIRETARRTSTGRIYSQESKDKKSKTLMGHTVSEEVRDKLRAARSKAVLQYTLEGVFIREWASIKEARITLGVYGIELAAIGKGQKQSGGFKWEYKEGSKTKKNKPVSKYSMGGIFIETYPTIKSASINNKISPSDISQVCLGNGVTAGGFIWKYFIQ